MHPTEFHWLMEAKAPVRRYAGGMTEAEVEELYEDTYGELNP